jgi:hypothetical protein
MNSAMRIFTLREHEGVREFSNADFFHVEKEADGFVLLNCWHTS